MPSHISDYEKVIQPALSPSYDQPMGPTIENIARNITDSSTEVNAAAEHKARVGLTRLWHAGRHSVQGLQAAWMEKAFRLEALADFAMLPAAMFVGKNWFETAVLAASVIAVLVTELLNSAIETTVDRIGPEWHVLSKKAKDMGSAAVLLALVCCGGVWTSATLALL